jgi:hypothetical protein
VLRGDRLPNLVSAFEELTRRLPGFDFVDTFDALAEDPDGSFGPVDRHLQPAGYYSVARNVAAYIDAHQLLPGAASQIRGFEPPPPVDPFCPPR